MSAAAIEKAADELMANYADCIDDGRFDDWLELFTEDASYKVVARDNHDQVERPQGAKTRQQASDEPHPELLPGT